MQSRSTDKINNRPSELRIFKDDKHEYQADKLDQNTRPSNDSTTTIQSQGHNTDPTRPSYVLPINIQFSKSKQFIYFPQVLVIKVGLSLLVFKGLESNTQTCKENGTKAKVIEFSFDHRQYH